MSAFEPDFKGAQVRQSPNCGERRNGRRPDMLVMHYTGMATADEALDWLCSGESQVSSHYFVNEAGVITQMVPESVRAWHAGESNWQGETDTNSASIGIEIAHVGHRDDSTPDFPDAQIRAVIELSRDIIERNPIPPQRVLAHSDIAPLRKQDPGETFPWERLHAEGIGHWVEPLPVGGGRFFQEGDSGQPVEALQTMLALYGYGLEVDGVYSSETSAVVRAFQRHFRPARVDGVADASTIGTLHKLLSELPGVA
ncbi:N-acetylmuramoyl-L-alanine amidase [Hoeflea sp.]|uniref:N-acetylmuramoyl-L-alanine amidase n=1 Tax=Hoeflea sp. TaxID=1940281 RepID=UPI003B51C681